MGQKEDQVRGKRGARVTESREEGQGGGVCKAKKCGRKAKCKCGWREGGKVRKGGVEKKKDNPSRLIVSLRKTNDPHLPTTCFSRGVKKNAPTRRKTKGKKSCHWGGAKEADKKGRIRVPLRNRP